MSVVPPEILEQILYRLLPGPDDFYSPSEKIERLAGRLKPVADAYSRPTPRNIFIAKDGDKFRSPKGLTDMCSAALVCRQWYLTSLRVMYEEIIAQPLYHKLNDSIGYRREDCCTVEDDHQHPLHITRNVPKQLLRTLVEKPDRGSMIKRLVLGSPLLNWKGGTDINIGIILACNNLEDLKIHDPSPNCRVKLREALGKLAKLRSLWFEAPYKVKEMKKMITLPILTRLVDESWPRLHCLYILDVADMWTDKMRTGRWLKSIWDRDITFYYGPWYELLDMEALLRGSRAGAWDKWNKEETAKLM